jgi:CheY-like chemotaxis protein
VIAQAKSIVLRQALHLGRITDDLLDAGRVMLGKITLNREPIDLARTVSDQLSTLNRTGGLLQHRVIRDLKPVWVLADSTRMQQIIGNLLANAIKFTPAGGVITVTLRREGGDAVLRVEDTGVGLEPELVPRVFDLFVQGKTNADRARGGLGIGLTLVRRLAELHGGNAEARSEGRGSGSEFTVRLPAIEAPPAPRDRAPDADSHSTFSVVIVEDNDDARSALRQLLELDGHRVREAADGAAGIEAILAAQPDVALIDIGLPGVDGFALAREVRQRAARAVRLIALTGYGARPDDAERAVFDAYVVKPLDPSQLRALMSAEGTQDSEPVPSTGGDAHG